MKLKSYIALKNKHKRVQNVVKEVVFKYVFLFRSLHKCKHEWKHNCKHGFEHGCTHVFQHECKHVFKNM